MALEIFKLKGSIFIDNEKANKSIAQTSKKGSGLAKSLASGTAEAAKMATGVALAGAAAASAAAGGIYKLATSAAETADNVDKMSQKIGISRQTYQELDFICSQTGGSVDSLKAGMKTLTKVIDVTAAETSKQKTALEELGVEAKDTNGNLRNQEEVMWECMTKLQGMEDQTKKAALASKLFGKAGTEMMPMLNGASGSIEEMKQKAHELGLVMGDEAIDSGVKLTDTIDQVKRSFSAIVTNIGVKVMPIVQKVMDAIVKRVPEIRKVVGGAFSAISGYWDRYGKPVMKAVFGNLKNAYNQIKGYIPELKKSFKTIGEAIKPAIKIVMDLYGTQMKNRLNLLVGIFIVLSRGVNKFASIIRKNMPQIQKTFGNASSGMKDFYDEHLKPMFKAINKAVNALKPVFKAVFTHYIVPVVKASFNMISELWEKTLKPIFTNIVDFITNVFSGDIGGAFTNVVNIIGAIWQSVITIIKNPLNIVIGVVNSFMGSIVEGINSVIDLINDTVNKLPDKVLDVVGFKGGISHVSNDFQIPYLAKGGSVNTEGMAVVGEAGAELINLPKGASVTPLNSNNNAFSETNDKLDKAIDLMSQILANMGSNIVLDTGVLVGEISNKVDKNLGNKALRRQRGVC